MHLAQQPEAKVLLNQTFFHDLCYPISHGEERYFSQHLLGSYHHIQSSSTIPGVFLSRGGKDYEAHKVL
jgi:hypothetical protein